MGQAVAKQGPNTIGNTSILNDTPIKVGKIEEPKAIDLFKKYVKLKNDKQEVEVKLIVKELGYLALAVTLAGFYISQTPDLTLDLRNYLPRYRRQRKHLLDQRPRKVVHQYGESVLTTWEALFESLGKQSPASAHFLMLLACISPDDIYTGLFCDLEDVDGPDLLWKRLLCLDERVDAVIVQDCLRHLAEYSLVQWKDEQGSYIMHKLVHAWVFERLTLQEQQEYAHATVELLSQWTSATTLSLTTKDRIIPHITTNQDVVNSALKGINKHSGGAISGMVAFYFRTTNFLYRMGKYSQALVGFRACSAWYNLLYGPEHPDTISAMSNLAITLRDQGKTDEAASIQQQVLEISKRILRPEYLDTISAIVSTRDKAANRRSRASRHYHSDEQLGCHAPRSRQDGRGDVDAAASTRDEAADPRSRASRHYLGNEQPGCHAQRLRKDRRGGVHKAASTRDKAAYP
ncbi:hypothetical protein FH972_024073 [Carpinus fangiana]|uniref:Uncharacterized protein n=1 Tax=Carpinus fangiana TaxID=176857 RepID=A0A5N6KX04_9ROSI|nr:hypothetical protein FH972_024073 [Carpinus fangiana]